MNETIFPEGMTWKDPSEKAPTWIKGQIHVNVKKLITWLQENPQYQSERGWIVFDMKESKNGTLYFSVNTWKPQKPVQENTEEYEPTPEQMKANSPHGQDYPVEGEDGIPNPADIPF